MKTFKILMACAAVIFVLSSCEKDSAPGPAGQDTRVDNRTSKAVAPVIDPVNGNAVVGQAMLIRNKNGVHMSYKADNLIPDHTYTVWWIIWNKPENCTGAANGEPCADADFGIADEVEVEVLFAAGGVVGGSGKGHFSGYLSEDDVSSSINDLFGLNSYGGLQDSETAEVHLVLRSHGPKMPGNVNSQISTYGGGCSTELPPFTEIPDTEGECADIQFAVFLP